MKYVKIFLVASLTLFGLASCGPKDAGTVGDATVDFYSDNLEGGFASDYLMVPIVLSNNEETTADVTLTVKPAEYTGAFAGEVDKDFMLTTENMVFKPGVDSINLEVMILNKDVDELRFMLEIAETNATAGAKDKILVSLAKTDLDRICTTWEWTWTKTWKITTGEEIPQENQYVAAWAANNTCKVSWDPEYEELNLSNFENWAQYAPIYAAYDAETNSVGLAPAYAVMWYSSANRQICAQFAAERNPETGKFAAYSKYMVGAPNETYTELMFTPAENVTYGIAILNYDTGALLGVYTYAYEGLGLVKGDVAAAPAAVPAKAAANAKAYTNKMDEVNFKLTDMESIRLQGQIIDALNAQMR